MIRDPFYRKVIERLQGTLEPELFERCAADLLRKIHLTLVPIRGGTDLGMDGAIADEEGEPFPLVSTTGKDVIGNLTRNLRSYSQDGGLRRKAVLATSQELTARRRENLNKRARELGFVLVQIHDQAAMADLLYRSPEWCRELLNLTGDPPPLSVVPLTERPLLTHTLIGRKADLAWLRQSNEDRLLVGQPGSGKTFLFYQLAKEDKGVFVVDEDRGKIAEAIRSEQPSVLFVDDAHIHRDLVVNLRQMREDIGVTFSILASCWPGAQSTIAQVLSLSDSQIHHLDLLTRDDIVEVIKSIGIHGPNNLIREIVDQAEGRPGLAVTLAYLCLQGGVKEVALGDTLQGAALKFFEPFVGQRASEILAAFAIGGDSGMQMDMVSSALELRLIEVREAVTQLAAGGVIWPVNQDRLSVRPAALRYTLVRDVFFSGAMSLPIKPLLVHAPNLSQVARVLIGARVRGATIPQDLLLDVLERAYSEKAWEEYAWLGPNEANWVLTHHPKKLRTVARPALRHIPEIVTSMLLEEAVGDKRQLHSAPGHPLRLINDWVQSGYPGTGEGVTRRKILFKTASAWLLEGNDISVGLQAFQSVLSPKFRQGEFDPGIGRTYTRYSSSLSRNEIMEIQGLWPKVLDVIKTIEVTDWTPVRNMVSVWGYPERVSQNISSEIADIMLSFAGQMLSDIIPLAKERSGVLHWINNIAKTLNLNIDISLDKDFNTLYPEGGFNGIEELKVAEAEQIQAVRKLADEWNKQDPERVIRRIVQIEQEAQLTELKWPRWTPLLCRELSEKAISPNAWIRLMIDINILNDLIEPFLRKSVEKNDPGWIDLATVCLKDQTLRGGIISVVLTLLDPPEDLLTQVLLNMEGYAQLIETLCVQNKVAESLIKRLLHHEDVAIASAAAKGEWYANPKGIVRNSLLGDWRNVIIREATESHFLSDVLKNDPVIAQQWLEARLVESEPKLYRYDDAVLAAVSALDVVTRRRILQQIPVTYEYEELVRHLVGGNLKLYSDLLSNKQFKRFHLIPLSGYPEGIWIEKAKLALDAGYSVEEVAHAVHYHPLSSLAWIGGESGRWVGWIEQYNLLCLHEDERIRKVGEAGKAHAEERQASELKQEQYEAIYGLIDT